MSRVTWVLALFGAAALVGCGSSASLEFAKGDPSYADAGDDVPYPDAPAYDPEAANTDTPPDVGEAPKCAPGKDGQSNICVRVLRASEGPTLTEDAKSAFKIDGHGAVLVALAKVKPGADVPFVVSTWLPTESSGAGKLAATELPKVAELAVPPGTYWAFAVFHDQEPYMRPNLAVGDYFPRLVELPQVTVVAGMGVNVDVKVHPVRAIDLELRLTATPSGNGAGPAAAWFLDGGKIAGEGRSQCSNLASGATDVVRVFTTHTGEMELGAALFDFALPSEDPMGALPAFPPGTIHSDRSLSSARVKIAEGEWLAPKKRLDLDKIVAISGPKPTDPSPSCSAYSTSAK